MSYNFVNNVEISEQPLSLAELESSGAFEEEPENPVKPAEEPNPNGVVPLNLEDTDDTPESSITTEGTTIKPKSNKNVFEAFVHDFLKDNGIDPEDLELPEIKDSQTARAVIADLYSSERDTQIEDYKNNFLTPLQKRFADLVEQGVSPEDAGNLMVSLKTIEGITEETLFEDKTKAKAVFKEYLKKTTKFSDAKINKEIELKDELGTLEEDAKEVLGELASILKSEEENLVKAKQEEENKKILESQIKAKELQDYLESVENIGGFQLNKTLKEKWKKEYGLVEIDTPQGKMKVQPVQAARLHNPTEFDALMRLYNTMGLFKFDARKKTYTPDFSALKALGAKETISEFEKAVTAEGYKRKLSGGASIEPDEDSKDAEINKWKEFSKKYNQK